MPKSTPAGSGTPQPLSPSEIEVLQAWSPAFFNLPIHAVVEQEMEVCMQGIESGALIGLRGSGKTYVVEHLIDRFRSREFQKMLVVEGYQPREIVHYESSDANGAKTALVSLYETLGGPMTPGARKLHTPQYLVELIAEEAKRRSIHLICVDEAQKIDAKNIDMLRQVPDHARRIGHKMGILFIGSEELRATLAATKQLGQRIATLLETPSLTPSLVAPHLADFHPHIGPLRQSMGAKGWAILEEEFFRAVAGSFRRMQIILANANQLALRMNRHLDAEVLRLAIGKIVSAA